MDMKKPGNTPREIIIVALANLLGTSILFLLGTLRNPF